MSQRFCELFRIDGSYYSQGSPVILSNAVLQKDSHDGKIILQVKISSVSDKQIIACKICVDAFEINNGELEGVNEFSYLDLKINNGEDFGTKIPIYMPDANTRKVKVSIIEVIFSDYTSWTGVNSDWIRLSKREKLINYLKNEELVSQYNLELSKKYEFVPVIENGLFRCACGCDNTIGMRCNRCNKSYEEQISHLDLNSLSQNLEERQKRMLQEKEDQEKLVQEAKEKRHKKFIKFSIPIGSLLLVVAVIIFSIYYFNPERMNLRNTYREAEALYNSGEYSQAAKKWQEILDYKDSTEKIKEARYQDAQKELDEGHYPLAIRKFKALDDYKDSSSAAKNATYEYGCKLLNDNDYINAVFYFESYDDDDNFKEKSLEAKYNYVLNNYSYSDSVSDEYLNCLLEEKYPGAEELYEDLRTLKVEIYAINDSEDSDTDMHSIDKNSTIYVHYSITGGEPYEIYTIRVESQLPNCNLDVFKDHVRVGDDYWFSRYYTSEARSGTFPVKIYNDNTGELLCSDSISLY